MAGWYLFGAFLVLSWSPLLTAPGRRCGALVPIWCPFGAYPEPRPIETSLRALASRKDGQTKVTPSQVSRLWTRFKCKQDDMICEAMTVIVKMLDMY